MIKGGFVEIVDMSVRRVAKVKADPMMPMAGLAFLFSTGPGMQ